MNTDFEGKSKFTQIVIFFLKNVSLSFNSFILLRYRMFLNESKYK